jgi:hypothetical protein
VARARARVAASLRSLALVLATTMPYALGALAAAPAAAHEVDATYVRLAADARTADVDVALARLDGALQLDADADGRLAWGEVRSATPRVSGYVGALFAGGARGGCRFVDAREPRLVQLAAGAYVRLTFDLACPTEAAIDASRAFDDSAAPRVYVEFADGSGVVLLRDAPRFVLPTSTAGADSWRSLAAFFVDGIVHLLNGADHVAFLAVMLLGVTLASGRAAGARDLLRSTAAVVTAFTLAHSATLALAATGTVRLPSAPVEVAIAASVLIAALGIALRRPVLHGWPVAFAFGLVHGLGFASVLGDLLQGRPLLGPLLAFNLGIEAGQLAIAAVLVPLLALAARSPAWHRRAAPALSLVAGIVAIGWIVERMPWT